MLLGNFVRRTSGTAIAVLATFFALPLAGTVFSGTVLDSTADASSEQATVCCWYGTDSAYCRNPGACAKGEPRCYSPYFEYGNGYYNGYMLCQNPEMTNRGEAVDGLVADPAPRLFVAPRGAELGAETVARLRTLTAVSRLQYLAAKEPELAEKKYADPRGALAGLGIALPGEMRVSIVRDEESGEDIVTIEAPGTSETLRYAADGSIVQREAEEQE